MRATVAQQLVLNLDRPMFKLPLWWSWLDPTSFSIGEKERGPPWKKAMVGSQNCSYKNHMPFTLPFTQSNLPTKFKFERTIGTLYKYSRTNNIHKYIDYAAHISRSHPNATTPFTQQKELNKTKLKCWLKPHVKIQQTEGWNATFFACLLQLQLSTTAVLWPG